MTKKALLVASGIADSFDLAFGWIIGPWTVIVDVPITILHFIYAGPRALLTLSEYVPFFGVLPIYTILAMSYAEDPVDATTTASTDKAEDLGLPTFLNSPSPNFDQPVYLQVHGQQALVMPMRQAIQLYQSGQVSKDTLWWHHGMAEWEPMSRRLE